MAYTTIDDGSEYFQAQTYTGNASDGLAITNSGNSNLQPDWLWIKKRSGSGKHVLVDSTRGVNKQLFSDDTDAEQTSTKFVASLDSDGFTLNDSSSGSGDTNTTSGGTYVGWQWKANGGTTSTNNDGSTASTVQANTTAGFSIVTFSRSAGGTITVGHGLGKKPDWIIVKSRQTTNNWVVTHKSLGTEMQDYYMILNGTDASSNSNDIFGGEPTTSVFSTTNNVASNDNQVAYCFTSIKGYSKFGSYKGNITSGDDGTFVYTGFKPAWIMVKSSSNSGQEWVIFDNKRDTFNQMDAWLYANANTAEDSTGDARDVDFLTNGFKFRNAGGPTSYSGRTYIYMAFAEHPFVSSKGVPVTAR